MYFFPLVFSNLMRQTQVMMRSLLDEKLWKRGLRLLSKICKAQRILPTRYIPRSESIRVGSVRGSGGYSVVSDGEYLGCTVAIKDIKTNGGDFDSIFKVRVF